MPLKRAQQGQEPFGVDKFTTDWKNVVADPEVNVVSSTAPNNMHSLMPSADAKAKQTLFCENIVGRIPLETASFIFAVRPSGHRPRGPLGITRKPMPPTAFRATSTASCHYSIQKEYNLAFFNSKLRRTWPPGGILISALSFQATGKRTPPLVIAVESAAAYLAIGS